MSEAGDWADRASRLNEQIDERFIEAARVAAPHLRGDSSCRQCGGPNDRAEDGYGACTDCVEGWGG